MSYWLLKTEPNTYSWDDLQHDKRTVWDGVSNPTALKHIRSMKKADVALIYHTGDERAIVGVASITLDPFPDPTQKDERLVVIELKPLKKLPRPVTLDEIKADRIFSGWDLLRIGRLSVVPVPQKMWNRIEQLAGSGG